MAMKAIFAATLAVMLSALATHADPIDPAQAIAQKFSDASDEETSKPSPKPSTKPAPKPSVAPSKPDAEYEADMLRRARAEEIDREKQQFQKIAAEPSAIPKPVPPPAVSPPAEKQPAPSVAAVPSKSDIEPSANSADAAGPPATQATILLVLDTESGPLGFKPDPIICIDDRCWLSNGIEAPAVAMPRTQAVALRTTEETTSDPCAGKSACVYRGVPLEAGARIEVIEVGESRGASAGAFTIAADTSCRKDGAALLCDNGLATQDFRIWVVPEAVATSIGPDALEDAVAEGLPDADAAAGNDK
ncbi:hypothetical protein [Hyphomicrobium sp. 99]|uniref:hypothetical protein n=1 Tax=Hyphomicrobium sp. 99 TaxID=1163419 RepID=UPI0012E0746F|nr:hypothetical protein [Hyphomicrobium sp. 99]